MNSYKSIKSCFFILFALLTNSVHAQMSSTIDMPKAPQGEERSNIGVSYFLLSSMPTYLLQKEGTQSLSAYNFVSLNYRLSRDKKVSFRPVFYWNTSGKNKYGDDVTADASLGDAHFVYSDYSMFKDEENDISLSGSYKLYLPTSQFSQTSKNLFQLRAEFYLDKRFSVDETITYVAKPELHFQSQRAFVDDTNPKFVSTRATRSGAFEHYLELKSDLNRTYSIKPALGFKEDWNYGSQENLLNEDHTTTFRSALGLEVRPARKVNFTVGLENLTRLSSQKNGNKIAFFHPDNNSIVLLLSASL